MNVLYIVKRYNRPDSISKVTGMAKYTADLIAGRKDVLVAKAYRLPCSCAKIKYVVTDDAKQIPGVVAILTAQDLKEGELYGYTVKDKPVIAKEETICDCDPVALIAAETEDAANEALKAIRVAYETIPAIEDPIESMQPEANVIRKQGSLGKKTNNISNDVQVVHGAIEKAKATTMRCVSADFKTPIVEHAALEKDIAIAEPDYINGGLIFYCPVQNVHGMREGLSNVLGLPTSKIRIVSPMIGGAFGGKECSSVDCGAIAGVLALHTKRTVVYEMTREEIFRYTSKRHRSSIHYDIGVDEKGKLTFIEAEAVFDKGAYKSVDVIPHRSALLAGGAYCIPAAKVRNRSVYTNHVYGGAFRGLGAPQQYFALECAIDDMARTIGEDPIEFRLNNLIKEGDTTIFGQKMHKSDEVGLRECILKVRDALSEEYHVKTKDPSIKRGMGIACYMYGSGSSFPKDAGHAYLELNLDGSLNVNLSQNEMGQGIIAAMTQIAAEAMGIAIKDVNIGLSDSLCAPESGPTSASRATVFQGNAIISGCNVLKKRMLKIAAEIMQESQENLFIENGIIISKINSKKCITLKEAVARARVTQVPLAEVSNWYPPMTEKDPSGYNQTTRWVTFAYGAHGVVVDVDTKTGIISVCKSIHATDAGRAINPDTVEGQMDGATAQAFGWALMEEEFLNKGRISQTSFHEYLIPTTMDMPNLESIIVESQSELGPYGAKGIGEPTILGGAPAIRNAVLDATGIAMYEIPMTPVRIMAALEAERNTNHRGKWPFFKAPLES